MDILSAGGLSSRGEDFGGGGGGCYACEYWGVVSVLLG